MMIVKVQRPLGSSDANPPALVYDRGRAFQRMVPLSAEVLALLGDRPKVYCEASVEAGQLVFGAVVADQAW